MGSELRAGDTTIRLARPTVRWLANKFAPGGPAATKPACAGSGDSYSEAGTAGVYLAWRDEVLCMLA